MNKTIINKLIDSQEINVIEQHLVYSFLLNKKLDLNKSPVISNFFNDFSPNHEIHLEVSSLNIFNLKLLENYLELLIPKEDRKVNGAFFTPTYVVDFIINEVTPKPTDKCLDPSCGCGAFLIGLVEYYCQHYNKSVKETIKENIYGSDILDYNVNRSKIILSLYGLLNNEVIEDSDFNIFNQDSLKADWSNNFQVIVGNPPYVKYQDLSDENRKYLTQNWETIENGTFNLYFAFFELGHKLLDLDGRLGYITPNNYFTSLAALPLRHYFLQNKCLKKVVDFSHKKVFDAQTYTAISFVTKRINEEILYDKIKDNQECDEFLLSVKGSPNYIKNLNVKKWRLLKTDEQENIRIIENIGTPIKELFNIAVGIATLKDEVFFVDGTVEEDDFYIKTTELGTFKIEKSITKPVYKISQFKSQKEIEKNRLRIITPYHTDSKTATPILENEFKVKYPRCYEYLLSERDKLAARDKGKKEYSPFYVWGRTQGLTRFGKKILNPTFSKEPRFLNVPEEDAYYTNGYGIYFDKDTSNERLQFDDLINPMSKESNILVVQKILNSFVMDYYITKTSVSIQGGYPCYQKNFIEKFSIPDLSREEIEALDNMTDKLEIDKFLITKYQLKIPSPNLDS